MFKDYLILAMNSLRQRKLRSWLTMIGIFIGVAAVVSLISLGQGMEDAITEQFFALGADKVQIVTKGPSLGPPGSGSDTILTDGDLRVVQNTNGVLVAAGRLIEPIRVEFNEKEKFLYMVTLPADEDERALVAEISQVSDDEITGGRLLKPGDYWKVLVSDEYILNPKFDGKALQVGDKIRIEGQTVDVVGSFEKTGNPIIDGSFVMNEEPIRQLLGIPEKYGLIGAQFDQNADPGLIAENIEKELRKYRNVDEGKEDFEVNTAEDILDTLTTVLGIITSVLVGIAGISLIVGGVGITNTMYTAVLERTREIGILKAIGARNSDVMLIFMIESGLLGLTGGIIGVLLGMGFSKTVEVIAAVALGTVLIQASFPWYLLVGSLVFSFLVGSLAGTFPALQASKLPPVEALRQ